jgi:GDP-L-fucose synthase
MKDKQVLITGATGLVGSAIDIPKAIRVSSKDFDLTNQEDVRDMFEAYNPTHVIHCAAKVGGLGANMDSPSEFFEDNILMNTMLLQESRLNMVERFVGFSSTCVFPDDVEYPLTPDKIDLGPPHHSNSAYAYAKRMAIVQMRAYKQQYGLNYTTVIPCNIYGPHDNYNLEQCHVIPALIRKCYEALRTDGYFYVWGSGKPMREFIYSGDVGKLAKKILFEYDGDEPIVLSTSEEMSISDIAHTIARTMGYTKKIIFETDKPDGQLRKPSDNTPLKKLFPDFEFTPIKEGLQKSISWFLEEVIE